MVTGMAATMDAAIMYPQLVVPSPRKVIASPEARARREVSVTSVMEQSRSFQLHTKP